LYYYTITLLQLNIERKGKKFYFKIKRPRSPRLRRSIMPHYAWWYFKNEIKTNAVNEVNYVDPIQEMAEDWGS
jgi:hypothetical protein